MNLTERLERARQERKAAEQAALGLDAPAAPLLPEPADAGAEPSTPDGTGTLDAYVDLRVVLDAWPPKPTTPLLLPLGDDGATEVIAVGTAGGLHAVADVPPDDTLERCPACGHVAVDMADLVNHITHYTCLTCGTLWQEVGRPSKAV